jgi:plasmid stabilization system protein ParE
MKILFTSAARQDLAEAAAWFEDHSALGGAAFATLVRVAVERIRESPFATPPWRHASRFRARTVHRVGYQIFYEIVDGTVRIVGIAHVREVPTIHHVLTIH